MSSLTTGEGSQREEARQDSKAFSHWLAATLLALTAILLLLIRNQPESLSWVGRWFAERAMGGEKDVTGQVSGVR
ncbi:MAG: hypothetical protein NZ959_01275 [Armatimonadetes bacterium]|nr:hypothetical protein [Armatimonadota bacterium]MDW8122121.1 hypothetical protein [Armatimonadota bacterium]